jgi:hypothetical protein
MPALTAVDDGPHVPAGVTAPGWRESWALDWHDRAAGVAAAYRIQADPGGHGPRARSWTLAGGEVTTRAEAPPPDLRADTRGIRAGGLDVRALVPLRSYAVTAGPGTSLTYTSGTDDAIRFSMSGQRADPGEHYESFGTVAGTIRSCGQLTEIAALGHYRHSWSVPDPSARLVRSVHGTFGGGLFFAVSEYRTPAGTVAAGYLADDGEFHGVEKARFHVETDRLGRPRGIDLMIATADRRDFRILGTVAAAAVDGPGFAEFSLGRYRGTGIVEMHPRRLTRGITTAAAWAAMPKIITDITRCQGHARCDVTG